MHILIIAPEQIPVPGSGSVEICILSIARQLAKHHKVTILSRKASKLGPISHIGNLKIVRVPAGSGKTYISSVLHYMSGKHYDFIQVDNRPHYMAKVKHAHPKTPVSLFLHSLTFVPKTSSVAASLRKADLIIANSTSLRNNLSGRFPSTKHKIRTVYLGVDTARFNPSSREIRKLSRKKYHLGDSFVIVFAGRVIPRKGVPVLIKAAHMVRSKVRGARLVIAGRGSASYIHKLKSQARSLNVPATFVGKVPHAKIHRVYQMADCFVCPSQKHESFGLVNVEAMSAGVPVVASKIGGIKEIISHGSNGYLVGNYKSPARFSHYITKIASHKEWAKKISRAGRQTVLRRFSWSQTAHNLASIYTKYKVNHG